MRVFVACDESGAKGYADQSEQYPGQVGVFAAILFDDTIQNIIETEFEEAIKPYRKNDGKLHIMDLLPLDQETLRNSIYQIISTRQLPCFWYAIHVEGYHNNHLNMEKILHTLAANAQASSSHIKRSSNKEKPKSLHSELFIGLYANIIAFIEERAPGEIDIEVRTDHVDNPIAKQFKQMADQLLDDSPRTITVTAFDSLKNEVISGDINFAKQFSKELEIDTEVKSLKLQTVDDSDPVVVAADILANSLNYHFKNRSNEELYLDLNRPNSISTHPLAKNLDTFQNWGEPDLMGDRMYRHPKAPPLVD